MEPEIDKAIKKLKILVEIQTTTKGENNFIKLENCEHVYECIHPITGQARCIYCRYMP